MTTPLDALAEALRDCRKYASGAEAPPEAILWCDPGEEFVPVLPMLRARLPNLLSFGTYEPAARTGPALWLRAAAARRITGLSWADDEPPIIYLPGRGREVLRGADDCPQDLAPLVWLAVAGTFFGQPKQSRDWTLRGFLAAQGSPIGLDVPEDKATREALGRAARQLFAEPVEALKGRRLDAAALNALLVPDLDADMLKWIDGTLMPETDPERFTAFAALAAKQLGIDPRKKSRQDAAARLAQREKRWAKVWDRFEDRDGAYEGVVKLLRDETPQSMFEGRTAYPKINEAGEEELRRALLALGADVPEKASSTIQELEERHGWRRETVWARRGEAILAQALEHLAVIAQAPALPTHDAQALADAYVAEGWKVDWAAIRALDIARTGPNREAVSAALRAVYLPWLDAGATALQQLAADGKVRFAEPVKPPVPPKRVAMLFVDGLRLDLAQQLAALLRAKGATATVGYAWSGFPTITATCKPLVSPAAGLLARARPTASCLASRGSQPKSLFCSKPSRQLAGSRRRACSTMNRYGGRSADSTSGDMRSAPIWRHKPAICSMRLPSVALQLARRGYRVQRRHRPRLAADAGRVATAQLVTGLTIAGGKGHRVATLKEGAPTTYPRLPWSWEKDVLLATPTGARAFYAGVEYAHGGVSPQECILPVLDVAAEPERHRS